jgi:membrane protease YdiL (CAAX protease family)
VVPLLAVPLLVTTLVLRASPRDFGWRAAPARRLLAAAGLAFAAVGPLAVALAFQPEFRAYYPSRAFPPAREHAVGLAFLWVLHHGPQLLALESCVRGFLFFPLLRRGGLAGAVAALLPIYVLLHLGKPPAELALAAWGGLVFMVAAARTGSFLPAFLAHWGVAVTVDALCFAQLHGRL